MFSSSASIRHACAKRPPPYSTRFEALFITVDLPWEFGKLHFFIIQDIKLLRVSDHYLGFAVIEF